MLGLDAWATCDDAGVACDDVWQSVDDTTASVVIADLGTLFFLPTMVVDSGGCLHGCGNWVSKIW